MCELRIKIRKPRMPLSEENLAKFTGGNRTLNFAMI